MQTFNLQNQCLLGCRNKLKTRTSYDLNIQLKMRTFRHRNQCKKLKKKTVEDDALLCENAPITVAESLLLLMTFAMTYHLTGQALSQLLIIINLHCIQSNKCVTSLFKFHKYFENLKNPLKFHYFCCNCFHALEDNNFKKCTNTLRGEDLTKEKAKSFSLEVPVATQIQNVFKKEWFWRDVSSHRFTRVKKVKDNLEDIYDGKACKKTF